MELILRITLQMPVNGDVAGVAYFLGEVGGVVDKLRAEIVIFLGLLQDAQIHSHSQLLQRPVDEARVPGFVSGHVTHQFGDILVFYIFFDFLVQHAA